MMKMLYKLLFVLSLSLALFSCVKETEMDAESIIGEPLSELLSTYGEPSSIDTISCWLIGDGNRVEISSGTVYDFHLNPQDEMIQGLMRLNKENHTARLASSPSLLDARLLMPAEDLSYLDGEVDSVLNYAYYNYGKLKRVKVKDGVVMSIDRGMRDDLIVLDKIRLNLGEGSMMVINITIAFIMFGIALNMRIEGFKHLLKHPRSIITGVFSQFILLPFVTFLLVLWLKPPPSVALGMVLVAACPGGNISNFICTLAKGNIELSVALTAIATILAVVMTPFNFAFWGGLYANASGLVVPISIDWWEMTKIVLTLLGLPILIGMSTRHFLPKLADKVEKPMKYFSIIFFLAIVVGAVMQNVSYFKLFVGLIFGIVLLHNFVAFLTGYSFATIMRVRSKERRSITIETGIQNSGLALVLIVNPHLFDGLGGMAFIAAFWGIWHIVSGMIIGGVWSRIKDKSKTINK
jgi:BASS family bile acid:Na+ symporter